LWLAFEWFNLSDKRCNTSRQLSVASSAFAFNGNLMEISIRRATPADAASVAAVEVASWRAAYRGLMPGAFLDRLSQTEHTASWRANLLKHAASGHKRLLVAVEDQKVVGFVRVGPESESSEVGLVYLLYVLPEYWGRGVGTALMCAAMDELRDLGVRETTLWVLRDNQRARRFYEGLGWHRDGQTSAEDYGGVELEAWCYRRTIEP
jgi:ribosomal protein S18 acetylase RimI-like enzyme